MHHFMIACFQLLNAYWWHISELGWVGSCFITSYCFTFFKVKRACVENSKDGWPSEKFPPTLILCSVLRIELNLRLVLDNNEPPIDFLMQDALSPGVDYVLHCLGWAQHMRHWHRVILHDWGGKFLAYPGTPSHTDYCGSRSTLYRDSIHVSTLYREFFMGYIVPCTYSWGTLYRVSLRTSV